MFTTAYKRYVLGLLTVVYTLNFVDRNLTILLLQPIKDDLHLTDTQLGFLTGIAFGLFYATLGMPFARWADRGNRVTLTSIAIGLWGLTVMGYLFFTNFLQLTLGRIASAVGEAGCMPPTYSLLGDYFPKPTERVRAMAVYWVASPLSTLLSFFTGGWLNERYGWRFTFFVMGIPALLIAVVVKWTIKEPRTLLPQAAPVEQTWPGMGDVARTLWLQKSSRHLCVAIILLYLLSLGLAPWYAAFLTRSHGMSTVEVGLWLGSIFGVSGTAGILLGGYGGGRLFPADEKSQLWVSAAALILVVPFSALFLLLPGKLYSLAAFALLVIVLALFLAPTFTLMQRLVAGEIRSRTLALVMLLSNLIGMGLGPLTVGMISDALKPRLGTDSLRYAMLGMSLVSLWAAYHLMRVRQTVVDDLAPLKAPATLDTPQGLIQEIQH